MSIVYPAPVENRIPVSFLLRPKLTSSFRSIFPSVSFTPILLRSFGSFPLSNFFSRLDRAGCQSSLLDSLGVKAPRFSFLQAQASSTDTEMAIVSNKGIVFRKIPHGIPVKGSHLRLQATPFDGSRVPEGGILTRNLYLSFDPYLRLRMVEPAQGEGCFPEFQIGKVITTYGICEVIATDCSRFKVGNVCRGVVGAEEFSVLSKESVKNMTVLRNDRCQPLSYSLGILGLPGLTA